MHLNNAILPFSDGRISAAEKDVHRRPVEDQRVINVASGVPPQPSAQVIGKMVNNRGRGKPEDGGVRLSQQQQQQKKAPRRGLIDDFMPRAHVVCYYMCILLLCHTTCTCIMHINPRNY